MRNYTHRLGRLVMLITAGSLLCFPAVAKGAPPANDHFDDATTVTSFPFSQQVTGLADATVEPGEPPAGCFAASGNAWYRLEPTASQALRVAILGSVFADWVSIYRDTGSGLGGLDPLAGCVHTFDPLVLTVAAGNTYYVQVSRTAGAVVIDPRLDISVVAPPVNDHFVDAAPITSVPFTDSVDTVGATAEPGEPTPCTDPASEKTVWYAYTPTSSGVVMARGTSGDVAGLAVYVGSSVDQLTSMGCTLGGEPLTVVAEAGATYYFQMGLFGSRFGVLDLTIEAAPPPLAELTFSPPDPTSLEQVQFDAHVLDPAQLPVTVTWDFGDGTTSTEMFPRHRFVADGDFTTTLTATTEDGRSATVSQVVSVRTHDVDIAEFDVPQTARAGQTRSITVEVSNSRYAEAVEVSLFKSLPSGDFVNIGSLTQTVPPDGPNQTTAYRFSYTFTDDDATATKVTFRAVATISHRDALPADNAITTTPTRIKN